MYLCFEEDDKRMVFPEHSLVHMDDNGFTLRSAGPGRPGKDIIFLKINSFQGALNDFAKALGWIKKKPRKPSMEMAFVNAAGENLGGQNKPAAPSAPVRKPIKEIPQTKLPETPSF